MTRFLGRPTAPGQRAPASPRRARDGHRPPARTRTSARTAVPARSRVAPIVAATIGVVLVAVGLLLLQRKEESNPGAVVVAVNVDSSSAGNGLVAALPTIRQKTTALAAAGGGTTTFIRGSGNAAQVVATVDTTVLGPDGTKEADAETRNRVIAERLDDAVGKVADSTATEPGRPLLPLLAMTANLAPTGGSFDIVYIGFGMSDLDPLDMRQQVTGMDPSQSVASVSDRLPQTPGARYTLIFTAAAGPQESLNTTTAQWRRAWWTDMAATTGASIIDISDDNTAAEPSPGAPAAAPIPNIPESTLSGETPTPTTTSAPPPPPLPDPNPEPATLNGALFQPDSAEWVDADTARAKMQPLADAWAAFPGKYQPLTCTGRTARFGPADTARSTATARAAAALALGRELGITQTADPVGLGYDQPLPPYPPTAPEQRSVICELLPL